SLGCQRASCCQPPNRNCASGGSLRERVSRCSSETRRTSRTFPKFEFTDSDPACFQEGLLDTGGASIEHVVKGTTNRIRGLEGDAYVVHIQAVGKNVPAVTRAARIGRDQNGRPTLTLLG